MVNPNVSYSSNGQYAKNGSKTEIVSLYTVLKQCASGDWKNREKGSAGCIFPYESNIMTSHASKYDGVIFIDIDKFNDYTEISGLQNIIFERCFFKAVDPALYAFQSAFINIRFILCSRCEKINVAEYTAAAQFILILQIASVAPLENHHRNSVFTCTAIIGNIKLSRGMAHLIVAHKA